MNAITLDEIIENLDIFPEASTIYATCVNGAWQPNCWAIVTSAPASCLPPSERRCLDYFMEVWAAKQIVANAEAVFGLGGARLSLERKLRVVTNHARSAAYAAEI